MTSTYTPEKYAKKKKVVTKTSTSSRIKNILHYSHIQDNIQNELLFHGTILKNLRNILLTKKKVSECIYTLSEFQKHAKLNILL